MDRADEQAPIPKPADVAPAVLEQRKQTLRIRKDAFVAGAAGMGFTLIGLGFSAYCSRFTTESLAYNRLDSIGPFLVIVGVLLIVGAVVWIIWTML